jgi:hypothetical protein
MGVTTRRPQTKAKGQGRTIRRSFALPRHIVTEASAADPAITRISRDLLAVFRTTEADGLPDD